jgi:hypothetical protein
MPDLELIYICMLFIEPLRGCGLIETSLPFVTAIVTPSASSAPSSCSIRQARYTCTSTFWSDPLLFHNATHLYRAEHPTYVIYSIRHG